MGRYAKFFTVVALIIVIWGVVLPRLATTPTVRNRNLWLEERGIDPAAMYYTDLPMIDRVLAGKPVR